MADATYRALPVSIAVAETATTPASRTGALEESAQPTGPCLARIIHDDILQMLSVCLIAVELCQRAEQRGQHDQVDLELHAANRGLETVLATSRAIFRSEVRPADVGPGILDALGVCLSDVERCRRLFRDGQGEPALCRLELLLERIETVAGLFQQVMTTSRHAG